MSEARRYRVGGFIDDPPENLEVFIWAYSAEEAVFQVRLMRPRVRWNGVWPAPDSDQKLMPNGEAVRRQKRKRARRSE